MSTNHREFGGVPSGRGEAGAERILCRVKSTAEQTLSFGEWSGGHHAAQCGNRSWAISGVGGDVLGGLDGGISLGGGGFRLAGLQGGQ